MRETEYIEKRPQPAFALLTFTQYFQLNHDLSIAKGYDLSKGTQRVMPMNPQAAKVNIQYDAEGNETGYEARLVAEISSEIQLNYPELIEGLELVDTYTHVDEPVNRMIVGLMESEVIDWTISHFIYATSRDENMVLVISPELGQMVHPDVLSYLEQLGIKVEIN